MVVLVHIHDPEQRDRVLRALSGWAKPVVPPNPNAAAVCDACASSGCIAAVVGLPDQHGTTSLRSVRLLRDRWPALPILVHAGSVIRGAEVRMLLALGRIGVNDGIVEPITPAALRTAFERHAPAIGAGRALRDVLSLVAPPLDKVVLHCLTHPIPAPTVDRVASALGVHRRTLVNWSAAVGAPRPSRIVTWCRVLLAAHALEQTGLTVERVAGCLGFESGPALRGAAARCGLTLRDLRRPGGFAIAVAEFRNSVCGHGQAVPLPAPSGDS